MAIEIKFYLCLFLFYSTFYFTSNTIFIDKKKNNFFKNNFLFINKERKNFKRQVKINLSCFKFNFTILYKYILTI